MARQSARETDQLEKEVAALLAKTTTDAVSIQYLSNLVTQLDQDSELTRNQLALILNSPQWKVANKVSGVIRKTKLKPLINQAYGKIKKIVGKPTPAVTAQPKIIKTINDLPPKPNLPVIYDVHPYKNLQLLKDIEVVVVEEDFDPSANKVSFSMATPVWNEAKGIIEFLKSIQAQTLRPDEIIFTDGGSTDNTVQLIEDFASQVDFDITVIKGKRIPIARGRNLAIKKARNEIIVMADAGTLLDKNVCLNLVSCFKKYGNPELVGGIWQPINASKYTQSFIPDWTAMDWNKWLTSTRSMAVRKSLIKKVGYFPEHIFYGDDTLFDIKYRRISKKWVFNKRAVTYWDAPVTKAQYEKTSYNYGKGDGENGLCEYFYSSNLLQAAKADLADKFLPVRKEFLAGYLEGRMNRGQIEIKLRKIKGVAIFLTTIPFYENEQAAVFKKVIQMLGKNYKVICVNFYSNLNDSIPKRYLDIDYTLLELYYADTFEVKDLLLRYPLKDVSIQVIPEDHNPKFDHILKQLRAQKITILKPLRS